MPGRMPPTSQLDWLSSTTAIRVLSWSRATRDLLKSFGWGIAALHRLLVATKLPSLAARPIASLRWREADSNFQFLGLGRAFLYRLGVTAPFLASSRNASGTAFVASNRGRPRRRVTLTPRLMTSSCRSALDECAFSCTHGPRFAYAPVAGGGLERTNLAKRPRAGKLRRR